MLRDSYKWILDYADFKRWRDHTDDQSRLLWIKGDPGKGKTMLLIGIIDELEQEVARLRQAAPPSDPPASRPTVLSYFFCQGTNSSLNNATAVLRGLVYLLAAQQPSLAARLRDEYGREGNKLFEGDNAFTALSGILERMLGDSSLARAYVVVDALDECENGLQQLLKLIVASTSGSRVKWIVSSRNRPEIEEPLEFAGHRALSLELNRKSIAAAVDFYICHKVSLLA